MSAGPQRISDAELTAGCGAVGVVLHPSPTQAPSKIFLGEEERCCFSIRAVAPLEKSMSGKTERKSERFRAIVPSRLS